MCDLVTVRLVRSILANSSLSVETFLHESVPLNQQPLGPDDDAKSPVERTTLKTLILL